MPILPIHASHELGEIHEWRQWQRAIAQQKKLEAAEKEAAQWKPAPTWRIEYGKPRPAFDNSLRLKVII
jgi:hypothetical protein